MELALFQVIQLSIQGENCLIFVFLTDVSIVPVAFKFKNGLIIRHELQCCQSTVSQMLVIEVSFGGREHFSAGPDHHQLF
jgi:hypothetical protein